MSAEPESQDDTGRAAKAAAMLGAAFTLGALFFYGGRTAASVALGAGIAVANLLTMRAIIRALIRPPDDPGDGTSTSPTDPNGHDSAPDHVGKGQRGGVAWAIFAVLKIVILFGGIWILLTRELVDPIPLVVGYGVLPLGIAVSSLWPDLGTRR